jgi:hypothetical protein
VKGADFAESLGTFLEGEEKTLLFSDLLEAVKEPLNVADAASELAAELAVLRH